MFVIIQQIYIKLTKHDSTLYFNKCCCFNLTIHQRILKKNLSLHKNMQQNIYWEANQYSNEAENASLFTAINYILKYIIIKKQLI